MLHVRDMRSFRGYMSAAVGRNGWLSCIDEWEERFG